MKKVGTRTNLKHSLFIIQVDIGILLRGLADEAFPVCFKKQIRLLCIKFSISTASANISIESNNNVIGFLGRIHKNYTSRLFSRNKISEES